MKVIEGESAWDYIEVGKGLPVDLKGSRCGRLTKTGERCRRKADSFAFIGEITRVQCCYLHIEDAKMRAYAICLDF